MKKLFFTVLLFVGFIGFSQNGINYKAIVKDNTGAVVANTLIQVEFAILQGMAQAIVYTEGHIPTTDANGLIILNIGEGTLISGDFTIIDWGSDEHFLNVKINTGGGLVDMGTTEFKSVPYANHATTADIANNVTGLEALDEGNGIGWRLRAKVPANYNNIGENAVDLSESIEASAVKGASGNFSAAMGSDTEASGDYSTAMGRNTTASGHYSTSMGSSTVATGNYSTAMGSFTDASGDYSAAMGFLTKAESFRSTAIGSKNIGGGNPTSWVATDPLFEIGNSQGTSSNALTVLKNGTITAPTFDLAEITDDKALITKEYADANLTASGLEAINEGSGIGWRLKGRDPDNYENIGLNAIDLSYSSSDFFPYGASGTSATAMGNFTEASGNYSTAMGDNTRASGNYSTAMGRSTIASEISSTAIGGFTEASGSTSTAMGNNTTASGNNATAMGLFTNAESYVSTAIGRFNIGGGNSSSWVLTDRLFEIGIGANNVSRNNAITVLKSGFVGIGENQPEHRLDIEHNSTLSGSVQLSLKETHSDFARLNFSNTNRPGDFWTIAGLIGTTTADDRLNFFNSDIGDVMSLQGNGDVLVNGSVVHSSDRRLKSNIEDMSYGLKEVMNLNPKVYNWKAKPDQKAKSLGLIAQEVREVINEVVHENTDEEKTLSISYTELIPVLIKAIQEQQKIIDTQHIKITGLSAEIEKKDDTQKLFNDRLEKMEALIELNNQ